MKTLYIYERDGEISGIGSLRHPPITHNRWFISEESPGYFIDKKVVDGEVVSKSTSEIAAINVNKLEELRADAQREVLSSIKAARMAYITSLPGQDAIYQAKEVEAKNYLLELPTTLDNYPLLAAEVGLTAPTAYELAQVWLNMASNWRIIASKLETARMVANQGTQIATSKEELNTIISTLKTTLSAI